MLKNLHIENFRGIRSLDMDGLGHVNILVGRNNCGKTSVLEAVWIWSCTAKPDATLRINSFRALDVSVADHFGTLFYRRDGRNEILLGMTDVENNRNERKICSYHPDVHILENQADRLAPMVNIEDEINGVEVFGRATDNASFQKCYDLIYKDSKTHAGNGQKIKLDVPVTRFLPCNIKSIPGMEDLEKLIESNRESELVDVLRVFDPRIKGIKFGGQRNNILIDDGSPASVPLMVMGDGVVRAVKLLASIATTGGIVLIDEIDNGIHTSVLSAFWKAIISFAKRNNTQVFATTHSWESIEKMAEALGEMPLSDADDVACFSMVKKEMDEVRCFRYDRKSFEASIRAGWDFR